MLAAVVAVDAAVAAVDAAASDAEVVEEGEAVADAEPTPWCSPHPSFPQIHRPFPFFLLLLIPHLPFLLFFLWRLHLDLKAEIPIAAPRLVIWKIVGKKHKYSLNLFIICK